jgi:membrane-associated protease RseP (regulator of RpoE activity)
MSVVFGLSLISLCLLLHELGHLIVALAFGLRVPRISLGFGPLLLGVRATGAEWMLVLPFFGECHLFAGANTPRSYEVRAVLLGAFVQVPALQDQGTSTARHVAILFAGPFANYLTATLIVVAMIWMKGGDWRDMLTAPLIVFRFLGAVFGALHSAKQLVGPIGVVASLSTVSGIQATMSAVASLSAQLFMLNLMPFPPLDGGGIAVAVYERARGRQLSEGEHRVLVIVASTMAMTFMVSLIALDLSKLMGWL